jgi:hypothetical protein
MKNLNYLKELHNYVDEAARLMVKNEDFGQRLEALADIEHEIHEEIREIDNTFAPKSIRHLAINEHGNNLSPSNEKSI